MSNEYAIHDQKKKIISEHDVFDGKMFPWIQSGLSYAGEQNGEFWFMKFVKFPWSVQLVLNTMNTKISDVH